MPALKGLQCPSCAVRSVLAIGGKASYVMSLMDEWHCRIESDHSVHGTPTSAPSVPIGRRPQGRIATPIGVTRRQVAPAIRATKSDSPFEFAAKTLTALSVNELSVT